MYVCFNGGLGSLYKCVLGNISNVWSQYFARKDRPTLLRVKTQMLDNFFFRESRFSPFPSACFFYICPSKVWQISVGAGFSRFSVQLSLAVTSL